MELDLQKIIKLLNLSSSPNDAEAVSAVRMANNLLKKAETSWEKILATRIVLEPSASVARRAQWKTHSSAWSDSRTGDLNRTPRTPAPEGIVNNPVELTRFRHRLTELMIEAPDPKARQYFALLRNKLDEQDFVTETEAFHIRSGIHGAVD